MSRPPCQTSPEVCTSRPAMMRSSVVLPQPEGPRKQTNSPLRMPGSISCRAVKPPKSLRMRRSSRSRSAVTLYSLPGSALLGLAVVAAVPFVQDTLAILGGPAEVHLHEAGLVVLGHIGQGRRNAGLRGDREVVSVQPHGVLARGPVGQLLGGLQLLRALGCRRLPGP